ncbi:MAG TPA: hypothetical protein PK971_01295 [Saprospiraceae bacterium]|nr:hypothetical protein [Saprospiraceae bacterium]
MKELTRLVDWGVDVCELTGSDWIRAVPASNISLLLDLLNRLDEGEAHAIALAVEMKAHLLLIDELEGRKTAKALAVPYTV